MDTTAGLNDHAASPRQSGEFHFRARARVGEKKYGSAPRRRECANSGIGDWHMGLGETVGSRVRIERNGVEFIEEVSEVEGI